ncbi:MAG: MipA/OmpV family protein [Erythrobacter sp.]
MSPHSKISSFTATALVLTAGLFATPALAEESEAKTETAIEVTTDGQPAAQPAPAGAPPFTFARPVFDDTWATIGVGAAFLPSYAGSDDYIIFPLPLIVGRVGGVGISPNGPGFVLDLNSPKPVMGPRKGSRVAFGPAIRLRNDRNIQIKDNVVARAGELDIALEVGGNVAVAFPGVFMPMDQLSVGAQVRWDVLGAHEGMIIEPQVNYRAPLVRAVIIQVQASAEIVDDSFADYYFSISPAQATATGLRRFQAEGGLNRIGTIVTLSYDLDRNILNGGWALTGIGGYARMLGDAADTPFTSVRGDANQFITGLGVAYTF